MSKKSLAVALSKLEAFERPKEDLEQYPTDSDIAAQLLHNAEMIDGLEGTSVLDLGAGTGILAGGALLLGAEHATLVDIDADALRIAQKNLEALGVANRAEFSHAAVAAGTADLVIMNPPFGNKNRHADRSFLDAAIGSALIVYAVLHGDSKQWVQRYAAQHGFTVTHVWRERMPLKQTLSHHRKRLERIPVILVRLEKTQ